MYPASNRRTVVHRPGPVRVDGASAVVPAHSSHPGPKPRGLPAAVWSPRPFRPSLALVLREPGRPLGGPVTAVPAAFGGIEPPRAQLGQVVLVRSFRSARILPAPLTPLFVSFRFVHILEKHLLKRCGIPGSWPSQEVEIS